MTSEQAIDTAYMLAADTVAIPDPAHWRTVGQDYLTFAKNDADTERESRVIAELGLWLVEQAADAGDELSRNVVVMFAPEIAALRNGAAVPSQQLPAC